MSAVTDTGYFSNGVKVDTLIGPRYVSGALTTTTMVDGALVNSGSADPNDLLIAFVVYPTFFATVSGWNSFGSIALDGDYTLEVFYSQGVPNQILDIIGITGSGATAEAYLTTWRAASAVEDISFNTLLTTNTLPEPPGDGRLIVTAFMGNQAVVPAGWTPPGGEVERLDDAGTFTLAVNDEFQDAAAAIGAKTETANPGVVAANVILTLSPSVVPIPELVSAIVHSITDAWESGIVGQVRTVEFMFKPVTMGTGFGAYLDFAGNIIGLPQGILLCQDKVEIYVPAAGGGFTTLTANFSAPLTLGNWHYLNLRMDSTGALPWPFTVFCRDADAAATRMNTALNAGDMWHLSVADFFIESRFDFRGGYAIDAPKRENVVLVVDELRISNISRAQTVPAGAYVSDGNTLALVHFDESF